MLSTTLLLKFGILTRRLPFLWLSIFFSTGYLLVSLIDHIELE